MTEERLRQLFNQYLEKTLTAPEEQELMAYIHGRATDEKLAELLSEAWENTPELRLFEQGKSKELLNQILHAADKNRYVRGVHLRTVKCNDSEHNEHVYRYQYIDRQNINSQARNWYDLTRTLKFNGMIKNYLRVAFRNLTKNSAFSFINISGLAIGMAACLLILQYVSFEFSYDDFIAKSDRLYRLNQDRYTGGTLSTKWAAGASAAGPALKANIPEVEDVVRLWNSGQLVVSRWNKNLVIPNNYYVEQSFFKMFGYPLLDGDPLTALKEPNSVVMSASTAKKLFSTTNVVGQTVAIGKQALKVTGVMQDLPENAHLKLDFIQSYSTLPVLYPDEKFFLDKAWFADGFLTYVLLKPGANVETIEKKFKPIAEQGLAGIPNEKASYTLQKVKDIHLYSNRMGEAEPNGDGKSVYLLLGIAIFVIVIAWINYINLATARGMGRAKEVGVRKTLGSDKLQLIIQFMLEAAVLNGLAILLAGFIIALSIPAFASLTGMNINLTLFSKPIFWLSCISLFLVGSFLSGFYPAMVLSGYRPVEVMKGKISTSQKGVYLRKGMVVFQFAASIFLLIGSITVYRQVQFMQQQKLGVDIDQTLVIRSPLIPVDSLNKSMQAFKYESLTQNSVKNVTVSSDVPGSPVGWNAGKLRLAGENEDKGVQSRIIGVDYDFLSTYNIKMLAGRRFSPEYTTDKQALILSRTALALFGFTKAEQAISKQIIFQGTPHTVVGVSDDFHQQSLRDNYDAIIFACIPDIQGKVSVKLNSGNISQTITMLKASWAKYFPGDQFDYYFLDKHFNEQYNADQRFGKVFGIFTAIAIFVACLGLFGLVSYTIVQRTKEIGIRKVLGASVQGILGLLYKDFATLIILAFFVAAPIAWYTISNWLHGYAFRISIDPVLFVVPFLTVLVIAFATVSWLSVKAALMNPVRSLKTE